MLHIGKVSNFAYPAFTPRWFSWYSWLKHTAIFPLPGPGAVTITSGLLVLTYSFISRKLQDIDKVLDSKLNILAKYETGIKEKDAIIAERQKQLKWLEDIEKKVNRIVKY